MEGIHTKQTCVLILGMHRSGTSLLAQIVRACGVDFGSKLLVSGADNPKGYFEHAEIVAINQALLETFSIDSDGIQSELPKDWLYDERIIPFKKKITEVIEKDFADAQLFGLKDPRISILLPLYLDILQELDIHVKCIVSDRAMEEVVMSLEKRNGISLTVAARAFRYFYRIIYAYTKPDQSLIVHFKTFFETPDFVFKQIVDFLGVSSEVVQSLKEKQSLYIDSALLHHVVHKDDLLEAFEKQLSLLEYEVSALKRARSKDLEWWESQLAHFTEVEKNHLEILENTNRAYKTSLGNALEEIKKLEDKYTQLEIDHRKKVASLENNHRAQIADLEGHISTLLSEKDSHIKELQTIISNIERSTIWKILKAWDAALLFIFPKHTFVHRWYQSALSWKQFMLNEWLPGKIIERIKKQTTAKNVSNFWETFFAAKPQTDILFVNHEESRTGAPRIVFDVAEHAQKHFSVSMVSLKKESMHQEFKKTFGPVIYPDDLYAHKNPEQQAQLVLERVKPKLVYVNSISTYAFAKVAKTMNIPVIFHVHELDIAFNVFFSRKERQQFKDWADIFIAVSQPVYDLLVHSLGCEEQKVVLINAFIDGDGVRTKAQALAPSLIRRELQLQHDTILIVCVGMFIYRKGADMFMQLAKQISEQYDNVKFVWIGSQPFKEPFMGDFAKYREYFTLLQEKSNPFPYVQAADIFILPAREDPFPLVVLEAMALGKPTVVFKESGGIHQAIGDAGIIVPDMTIGGFEKALSNLIEDKEQQKVLGSRAVENQKAYDTKQLLPKIQEQIQKLFSAHIDKKEYHNKHNK